MPNNSLTEPDLKDLLNKAPGRLGSSETSVATGSLGSYVRRLKDQQGGLQEYSSLALEEALSAKHRFMTSLMDDLEDDRLLPSDKIAALRIVNTTINEERKRDTQHRALSSIMKLIDEGRIKVDMSIGASEASRGISPPMPGGHVEHSTGLGSVNSSPGPRGSLPQFRNPLED